MSNCQIETFIRNRYFYGKLLTVRDFEMEQGYFNRKRNLINRLVGGTGIVCGLQVSTDGSRVELKPGVAIEATGKEIVVNQRISQEISSIPGFPSDLDSNPEKLYLCLEYIDDGFESVHSIAKPCSTCEEICENNYIQEGYKLVLKQEAPELQLNGLEDVWYSVSDVYDNEQINITRVFPTWVNPGEVFEVIINVVKKQGAENVNTVEFAEQLEHFTHIEGLDAHKKIRIIDEDFGDASEINYAYMLTADKEFQSGSISAYGMTEVGKSVQGVNAVSSIEITEESIQDLAIKEYFRLEKGNCPGCTQSEPLYLAGLSAAMVDKKVEIVLEESVPSGQYVYNNDLLYKLSGLASKRIGPRGAQGIQGPKGETGQQGKAGVDSAKASLEFKDLEKPEVSVGYDSDKKELDFAFMIPNDIINTGETATSYVTIKLPESYKAGECFYTKAIDPQFGKVPFYVELAVENAKHTEIITGVNVFSDYETERGGGIIINDLIKAFSGDACSLGAKISPRSGTFIIGIRMNKVIATKSIIVRWWAIKPSKTRRPIVDDDNDVKIIVTPEKIIDKKNITTKLTATVSGTSETGVEWSVKEKTGCTVNSDGTVEATATGAYHIKATSKADKTAMATALVVVLPEKLTELQLEKYIVEYNGRITTLKKELESAEDDRKIEIETEVAEINWIVEQGRKLY